MKKIYIVDASGYLYRSYFAIRNMTNAKGESTNALFGFVRSLFKLIKDFEPEYLVAVFDGPRSIQSREAIYAQYKAHRKEMPSDLYPQITQAKHFCQLAGLPSLTIEGVEADDTMGSIAAWCHQKGVTSYLCTSDKDLYQFVNENTFILNTHKDNLILDAQGVKDTFGVTPNQIVDFLAITGDSSDNVPGIPGFGPKTAAELLQKFGTLDYLLEHPTEIIGKKKQETLIQEGDKARLSRQLVTINTAVDIPKDLQFYQFQFSPTEPLKQFYHQMSFHSLLKDLEVGRKEEIETIHYQIIDDEAALHAMLDKFKAYKEICIDTETTDTDPMKAELVGLAFCVEPKTAYYVPVNGKLGLDKVIEELKPFFENPQIGFYGHHIKYDYEVLLNYQIQIAHISFDTLLASYVLNAHQRQHSLDTLALEKFGKVKIPIKDLIGKGKNIISMRDVPLEKVSEYACEDVDYTCRLKLLLEKQLQERKLSHLYFDLELPLLQVLAKMERHGIFLNVSHMDQLAKEVNHTIAHLTESIYQLAQENFNLNSPKQLGVILFEKLKIPAFKKTATGFSTSADILEGLRGKHPIIDQILEYRTIEKLRSTYIETLPLQVNSKTHRIHCNFNQSIAATGRLSSQDPNLQNIPIRSEMGQKIREAFHPQKPGWSFLSADYSQIELRLLAHLSEDPSLVQAFLKSEDIHATTAASVLEIPLDQVTKEQRQAAKAVNFGIIYGQQAFGLSQELGIEVKKAAHFIEMYFHKYPAVKAYLETCKKIARETGKAVTMTGRERLIPEISSSNMQIRQMAERLAVNTPFQGTAADLIKKAMLEVDAQITQQHLKGFMILQIHDELLFEVPDEEIPQFQHLVKKAMEQVVKLKVPLVVEIAIGKNWKEC